MAALCSRVLLTTKNALHLSQYTTEDINIAVRGPLHTQNVEVVSQKIHYLSLLTYGAQRYSWVHSTHIKLTHAQQQMAAV
jgi:hypothetical protein